MVERATEKRLFNNHSAKFFLAWEPRRAIFLGVRIMVLKSPRKRRGRGRRGGRGDREGVESEYLESSLYWFCTVKTFSWGGGGKVVVANFWTGESSRTLCDPPTNKTTPPVSLIFTVNLQNSDLKTNINVPWPIAVFGLSHAWLHQTRMSTIVALSNNSSTFQQHQNGRAFSRSFLQPTRTLIVIRSRQPACAGSWSCSSSI